MIKLLNLETTGIKSLEIGGEEMRSRFLISTHDDIVKAYKAKNILQRKNPDKVYQIRKGHDGSRIKFRLVERLQSSESKKINEVTNGPARPKIKRPGWTRKEPLAL
jgi:hypothetical protein